MAPTSSVQLAVAGTAAVFVGIPLAVQLSMGKLPRPGTPWLERLLDAVSPTRCVRLWRALCGQLAYWPYAARFFFHWPAIHQRHHTNCKGLRFGDGPGQLMDVYPATSADPTSSQPTPIAVFVYGGAWGSGLFGVLVFPNHVYAILTTENAARTLQYWQAGAHIATNAIVSIMIRAGKSNIATKATTDHENQNERTKHASTALTPEIESKLRQPMASALLKQVRAVIGLSGVYHIEEHFEVETNRGVEWLSDMHNAMQGPHNFARHSPAETIKLIQKPSDARWPSFYLAHGHADETVPIQSSKRFAKMLETAHLDVEVLEFDQEDHVSILVELMEAHYEARTRTARRLSGLLRSIQDRL